MKLRVLDLFSGIGGFSLGLHRAGGFETVAFCEIDSAARRVLAKHWPTVPIFDDVTKLSAKDLNGTVDVICGGFPCVDISPAGKRAGLAGERSGLWFEYRRLIAEFRPRWVIIENSSDLATRGLGRVVQSLDEIGYDAEWSVISACSLGFPHMRKRMYVVAYPQGQWREQRRRIEFAEIGHITRDVHQRFGQPEPVRVAHGLPGRMDRNKQLGNSVAPQIPQLIGEAILADRCRIAIRR